MTVEQEIESGIKEFLSQADSVIGLRVVAMWMLDGIIAAGHQGDMTARAIIYTIGQWTETINRAASENIFPACGVCGTEVKRGEVGGWMIMAPVSGQGTALTAPLCGPCILHDTATLAGRIRASVESELAVKLVTVQ